MNYSLFDFLTLLGSLGLFLYGMKLMSEGLQKLANKRLQKILGVMTSNRFSGVLTGVMVTALIQSSSATTVLVVSFVNAGLISLVQSIGVIMGANIGTTITAWIISVLGFKFDISVLSLPLLGIGIIPLMFSKANHHKNFGEFVIGFALLFMGLSFLKSSVPDLQNNPEALAFIAQFTGHGFGSVLIFLLFGTLLTVIVQSSSATVAITLIMCSKGWIPFEMGIAMVLGENIGTTITANIAALSANISAKRSALAHSVFNLLGICWMLPILMPFIQMVVGIVTSLGGADPHELTAFVRSLPPETLSQLTNTSTELTDPHLLEMRSQLASLQASTSYSLSLFHTIFNVTNTLLLIGFSKLIARIVTTIIPQKQNDEEFQLRYIGTNMLSASELAIPEAGKEIDIFTVRVEKMFQMVKDLLHEKSSSNFDKTYERLGKYENISDRMDVEIASFLNNVAEGRLSGESKLKIRGMIRVTSEIESIADSCNNLGNIIKRRNEAGIHFTDEMYDNIHHMFDLLSQNYADMQTVLHEETIRGDVIGRICTTEAEINRMRNDLRNQNDIDLENRKYTYQEGLYYIDLVREAERMGDYIINVIEAHANLKL